MRVHIVTQDHGKDHILNRLVDALTGVEFSRGISPDPYADLNYFDVYLTWANFKDFDATPTAAWFSHLDARRGEKVALWESCARAVDLRLTCVPMYAEQLSAYGPTEIVIPPLDRNKFVLRPPVNLSNPVIGTSGFVYPGGRKGLELWQAARQQRDYKFVSMGNGWDAQTVKRPWGQVQEFYHGIDVYLCTSLIEGIGYGPLEAMASGVPVVIPRGVGIFDELPALENLHRYDAGNVESMLTALDIAVETLRQRGYNPSSLRGATARFSSEEWTDSHLKAFEKLLYDVQPIPPSGPWLDKAVMVTVAYGGPARECAARLIKSWHKHMPQVPVALIAEESLGIEDIHYQRPDGDIGARRAKVNLYDTVGSEFEYILYLDADTECVADVSFLFDILAAGWEVVFCTNPDKYALAAEMIRPDNKEECKLTFDEISTDQFLQLNGGVFALRRNDRVAQLMREWAAEWERYGKRDQAALDRALYRDPVRVFTLGNEWNTITRYIAAERTAGILHYPLQARRWRGRIDGRLDSTEAWAAVHPDSKDQK